MSVFLYSSLSQKAVLKLFLLLLLSLFGNEIDLIVQLFHLMVLPALELKVPRSFQNHIIMEAILDPSIYMEESADSGMLLV